MFIMHFVWLIWINVDKIRKTRREKKKNIETLALNIFNKNLAMSRKKIKLKYSASTCSHASSG